MKILPLITSFILVTSNGSAQDILPEHTADVFDLKGDVKRMVERYYYFEDGSFKADEDYEAYYFNTAGQVTHLYAPYSGPNNPGIDSGFLLYDSTNKLVKDITATIGGYAIEEYLYSNNQLTSFKQYTDDSAAGYNILHKIIYNADGNPKIKEEYDGGELKWYTIYTYTDGLLTEEIRKTAGGKEVDHYTFKYENGVKKEYTYYIGEPKTIKYTYNSDGLLASFTNDDFVRTYEYLEFDKKGNWIKRRDTYKYHMFEGEETQIICREISYHDGYYTGKITPTINNLTCNFNKINFQQTEVTKNAENFSIKIQDYDYEYSLKAKLVGNTGNLLICEQNSNAMFYIVGYTTMAVNSKVTPLYLSRDKTYWCKQADDNYWIFYNGETLTDNNSTWVGDDLMVYNKTFNRTFLIKNFNNTKPNVISSVQEITNEANCHFKIQGDGFYLYDEGILTTNLNHCFINNDLIVYDSATQTSYRIKNYQQGKKQELLAVEKLPKQAYYCYKVNNQGNYVLIYNGSTISTANTAVIKNQSIVVTDAATNKKYLVNGFKLYNGGTILTAKPID